MIDTRLPQYAEIENYFGESIAQELWIEGRKIDGFTLEILLTLEQMEKDGLLETL